MYCQGKWSEIKGRTMPITQYRNPGSKNYDSDIGKKRGNKYQKLGG